jgi:hypothetical protein
MVITCKASRFFALGLVSLVGFHLQPPQGCWLDVVRRQASAPLSLGNQGGDSWVIGNKKRPASLQAVWNSMVAGDGIEPPTRGFSIPCSTN